MDRQLERLLDGPEAHDRRPASRRALYLLDAFIAALAIGAVVAVWRGATSGSWVLVGGGAFVLVCCATGLVAAHVAQARRPAMWTLLLFPLAAGLGLAVLDVWLIAVAAGESTRGVVVGLAGLPLAVAAVWVAVWGARSTRREGSARDAA